MRLKEKKLLKKFAATLKKFSAQGAKKVEYCKSVLDGFLLQKTSKSITLDSHCNMNVEFLDCCGRENPFL